MGGKQKNRSEGLCRRRGSSRSSACRERSPVRS
jgi:hypothetical protein